MLFNTGAHNNVNVKLRVSDKCLEVSLQEPESLSPNVFYIIHQVLEEGLSNICRKLKYHEAVFKPQFGFYCSDKSGQFCSSSDKHLAVVEDGKVKCLRSNRSCDLDKKRRFWFLDVVNDQLHDSKENEERDSKFLPSLQYFALTLYYSFQ